MVQNGLEKWENHSGEKLYKDKTVFHAQPQVTKESLGEGQGPLGLPECLSLELPVLSPSKSVHLCVPQFPYL